MQIKSVGPKDWQTYEQESSLLPGLGQRLFSRVRSIRLSVINILVALSILLFLFSLGTFLVSRISPSHPFLFSWRLSVLKNDRMEPTIQKDALLVVRKTSFAQVREGDVIAYTMGNQNLLGRVVYKTEAGLRCKSDNEVYFSEYLVEESNIRWQVIQYGNGFAPIVRNVQYIYLGVAFVLLSGIVVLYWMRKRYIREQNRLRLMEITAQEWDAGPREHIHYVPYEDTALPVKIESLKRRQNEKRPGSRAGVSQGKPLLALSEEQLAGEALPPVSKRGLAPGMAAPASDRKPIKGSTPPAVELSLEGMEDELQALMDEFLPEMDDVTDWETLDLSHLDLEDGIQ